MSQFYNQTHISPDALALLPQGAVSIVDVRKPAALAASGLIISGAVWRHPFDATNWSPEFEGMELALYCVHGHEVSLAVCGYLRDLGITAVIVDGGFEAWREAGLPVEAVGDTDV